jgi:hypothetical protein
MNRTAHVFRSVDHAATGREAVQADRRSRRLHAALVLSALAAVAMTSASAWALADEDLYPGPESVAAMLRGYDLVTLLAAAPLLVLSSSRVRRGSARTWLVRLGALGYAPYTYSFHLFGIGLS